jgi:hypothetical protein
MQKVWVEIEHALGDWTPGQRVRLEQTRARKIIRTGYAKLIETTDDETGEQAVKPPATTRTVRGERRG